MEYTCSAELATCYNAKLEMKNFKSVPLNFPNAMQNVLPY